MKKFKEFIKRFFNTTFYNKREINYYSRRYDKDVNVRLGYSSDGATWAFDLRNSITWWVHDILCDTGEFDDGTKCTNLQASTILSDILLSEGRIFRTIYWWPMTFFFGGGECRKNGMFKLNK